MQGILLSLALAQGAFQECALALERAPEVYDSALCYYRVSQATGLWEEGEDELRRAGQGENPWVDVVLGHFARRREDREEALSLYREAAERFERRSHFEGEVTARTNLRILLWLYGRSEEASRELVRLVEAAEKSSDPNLIAHAYQVEAHHLLETGGDHARAYRLLKRAEALLPADGPYRIRRGIVLGLGNASFEMGRFDEALRNYRELDRMAGEEGNAYTQATAQFNIANTRLSQLELRPAEGGLEEVAALAERALETAVEGKNPHIQVFALRALGEVLGSLPGRGSEARAALARCQEVADAIGRSTEVGHCLWTLASKLAGSEPREAQEIAESAVAVALDGNDPESLIRALRQRMRIAWKTEPRSRAIEISNQTLAAIESLRALQEDSGGRARVFSVWTEDYHRLSGYLLGAGGAEAGDVEAAFSVIERLRGRSLLEALLAAGEAPPNALAPERRGLLEEIASVQKELLDPRTPSADRERLLAILERLELEEQALRSGPEVADVSFASLEEVRHALEPDEALLSFQVALWEDLYGDFGGGSWVVAITRDEVRAFRIPDRVALEPKVSVFTGVLERRDGSETRASTALYQDLLREALSELPPPVDRLIVVPDGVLHEIPFDVLRAEPGSPPLVVRYQIETVPSATLWLRWRRTRFVPAEAPAIAFADPQLPVPPASDSTERNLVLTRGIEVGPLPGARDEAVKLVRHLGGESALRLDKDASERAVKETSLEGYGVVHFAAHAVADEDYPERSAVLLSPGSPKEDGLLQSREIAELDIGDRIVVLAACDTASGSVLGGEGVLSLSRAFFEGGARAVVGTRWPLRDDEAAVLFDAFYGELRSGASVSAALKAGKQAAIAADVPARGWSSLVLLGDGSVTPYPGGLPPPFSLYLRLAVMILLAPLALVVLGLRARKNAGR